MARRILVIGGGGMLGAPVVRALQRHNHAVRIYSRSASRTPPIAGAEVAVGDVLDEAALSAALDGCDGVHLSIRGNGLDEARRSEVGGAAAVAKACAARNIRLSYLSGCGLEAAPASDPFARIKRDAEAEIEQAGAAFTIFRATHFMEGLPNFVRDGRAVVLGRQPHRYHYLAAADFADAVARSFAMDGAVRRRFDVLGPEPFTMREALARYCAARRPDLKVEVLPLPMARLIAFMTGSAELGHAVRLFTAFSKMPEGGDGAPYAALFGPNTTTLTQWLEVAEAMES